MPSSPPARTVQLSPLGEWLFAAAFMGAGIAILAIAFGWIHVPADKAHAPRWVLVAAGLVFVAGGFVPHAQRYGPDAWQSRLIGAVVLLSLTVICNWVAFGPGPRQFSTSIGVPSLAASGTDAGETSGRAVFGMFAAGLDLLVIVTAVRWLRSRRS
jgi:hypothetical protein